MPTQSTETRTHANRATIHGLTAKISTLAFTIQYAVGNERVDEIKIANALSELMLHAKLLDRVICDPEDTGN